MADLLLLYVGASTLTVLLMHQERPASARQDWLTRPIAWHALAPMLILIAGAVLLLGTSAMSRRRSLPGVYALATVVIAFFAMFSAVPLWREVTDGLRLVWQVPILRTVVIAAPLVNFAFTVVFFTVTVSCPVVRLKLKS